MEPTTTPISKKSKIIILIVLILIILIFAFALFKNKNTPNLVTPGPNDNGSNSQVTGNIDTTINPDQITKDITSATTFDNEADLKAIDNLFQ